MSDHRVPYVGDGPDGCRRSAEIDRTEADGLDLLDPRIDELLVSADRWEAQAQDLERAQIPADWVASQHGDGPESPDGEWEEQAADLECPVPPGEQNNRCPRCGHMPHKFECLNMASDNDCNCPGAGAAVSDGLEAAHAVLDKLSEPRGYTIEGSAFLTDDHEFRKPPTPQEIATAVKDAAFNVTGLTSDGVFLLPAPNENTRTVVSKRGHLAMADALYARGRRDTPTGTVIARLDPLADRANWLAVRRTGIGSSDVPILLGLSTGEYAKSELDLYMDKRGEVPDDESGEAALWGTLLEDPVAREWAKRETTRVWGREDGGFFKPITVQKVGTIAHREHRHMLCDLDRRVIGCPDHERCALEVKTRSAYKASDWADGVPEDTLAQVMHQLAVTGYDAIHVAALIGGQKLVTYVVEPDADMIADLFAIEDQFWTENVLAGVPPAISSLDLLVDHLKHFTPVKGEVVRVHGADATEVRYLTQVIDHAKGYEAEGKNAENRLKALIGEDATDLVVVDDDGNEEPMWTWRPQNKPKQVDKPAVEAVLGAPLDSFKVSTGTTRVLRRVKAKAQ